MDMMYITLTVSTDDAHSMTIAVESMSRCAAGLAMEGVFASLSMGKMGDPEDTDTLIETRNEE